ncbi:ATP-dependent RNA helicase DHX30-like isoform X2 [Panulirus ornatus]
MADTHYVQQQKKSILRMFPDVKSTVKNMFKNISTNLDPIYRCEQMTSAVGRISHQLVFQCSFVINWPKPITFYGYGFNKKNAELAAVVKAAEMLYNDNYIGRDGYPKTISQEERQKLLHTWNLPPTITVPSAVMDEGWDLLCQFDMEIEPVIQDILEKSSAVLPLIQGESEDEVGFNDESHLEQDEEMPQIPFTVKRKSQQNMDLFTGQEYVGNLSDQSYRNSELLRNLRRRMSNQSSSAQEFLHLPMLNHKEDVTTALTEKRILIVAGDTGCGKSTQVPQMIMDQWIEEGRGTECNILVTQPRRISAVSLAKQVAKERGEKVGESVGYHVRLEYKRLRDRGGIMFCTTGMLLQGISCNPTLEGVSHIIVDEVHERTVQTDLLLILLHRLIRHNSSLRIILMSASVSTKQLQEYFGEEKTMLLEVPGTLFPLTRHYLPNAILTLGINPDSYNLENLMEPESRPTVNIDLVVDVIHAIELSRPPGAILCFLPGWQDISLVQRRLMEDSILKENLWVLPLHSNLTLQDQELVFRCPPQGQRKVVLATNIAETSLTIDDVVFVIDTGVHKEHRYNIKKDLTVLGNHWISKSNSQQRAGRAGRVQPGEVFHLYSTHVHDEMDQYPVPEIMRIPLEHVILQCKSHCGEESALSFLSDGLSIPSRRLISAALNTLEKLGMVKSDHKQSTEILTALGHRVVHFSTTPHLSKALVYASVFRCLDAVLTISAILSGGRGIFQKNIEMRARIRAAKVKVNPTSDLLAMLELVKEWKELESYSEKILFCNDHNLIHRSLLFNEGIKHVYSNHLHDGLLLDENISSQFSSWNANSHNGQLVLGVLLAGIGQVLHLQKGTFSKGILSSDSYIIKNEKGMHIDTGSECVLHPIPKDSPNLARHLLSVHLSRDEVSRRIVARDLSLLQPLTVILFAGDSLMTESIKDDLLITIDRKGQLSFKVDERTGRFLLKLRNAVDQMVNYVVETRGLHVSSPPVDLFFDELVWYINHLIESYESSCKRNTIKDDSDL